MGTEGQTGQHLLLAVVISVFSGMMILITVVMSWELWMVPVILTGNISVWFLHIGRVGSGAVYENLCAGVMMVEFFSLEYIEQVFLICRRWRVSWFCLYSC